MDNLDFIKKLASSSAKKRDGQAYYKFLKEASFIDEIKDLAISQKEKVLPAIIGAAVLSGAQAILNKRNKETGISPQQSFSNNRVENATNSIERKELEGKPLGFADRYNLVSARSGRDLSDLYADYPIRSALLAAPAGAGAALLLRNLALKVLKRG